MTTGRMFSTAALGAALAAAPAQAQQPTVSVVAVPPLTTPDTGGKGSQSLGIAWQATQMIATDLRSTSELMPLPPNQKDFYSYPEVTAPTFSKWRAAGAKTLVTGFVQSRADGRLTFGCYVYDVDKGRELARKGFVVAGDEWRRAAHKCSGLAYTAVTGAPGVFDTRIAYVAETGSGDAKVKRVAIMDSDGFDHKYLTAGDSIVLTPRLSPKAARVAYVTFAGGQPAVRVLDVETGAQRPLVANDAMTFAPRFSPDGSRIVFESDRSGSPQLYVMDATGANQRRLTFGNGWYAAPDWSPDGQLIAFTRRGADGRRIGIIGADGTSEKLLTTGPGDDGPSWAASSRDIVFQRTDAARRNQIFRVSIDGTEPRKIEIPQDGADPDWSGVMD